MESFSTDDFSASHGMDEDAIKVTEVSNCRDRVWIFPLSEPRLPKLRPLRNVNLASDIEQTSVDDFFASHGIDEDAIEVTEALNFKYRVRIYPLSEPRLPKVRPSRSPFASDAIQVTLVLDGMSDPERVWIYPLSKRRSPKIRLSRKSVDAELAEDLRSRLQRRRHPWLWLAISIAVGQFWIITLLSFPARAQCQESVHKNWLELSIEFIVETLKL